MTGKNGACLIRFSIDLCVCACPGGDLQDVTGKAVGIWLPISAFISIGGEHCIANQVSTFHVDCAPGSTTGLQRLDIM